MRDTEGTIVNRTLVVVGAGPGLGLGVARAFGTRGFRVALVARTRSTLGLLVRDLEERGVTAAAFPADIRDRDALTAALDGVEDTFGTIDVLEYSPSPTGPITGAAATTVESATAQFELNVLGAVSAVQRVLPGMRARGDGAILLTTGISSTVPAPFLANVGLAMAALRNWAYCLHDELRRDGVYVGTVTIASGVIPGGGEADPDAIGARYHRMYRERDRVEEVIGDPETFRAFVAQRAELDADPDAGPRPPLATGEDLPAR